MRVIAPGAMDELLRLLSDDGYEVVGPTVREGAIVYDRLAGMRDLPIGRRDEHEPGRYRLHPRTDQALFGYVVGPHSWKKYLFPPAEVLVRMRRRADGGLEVVAEQTPPPRRAFIGVRPCELAAIDVQDRVFLGQGIQDRAYGNRREGILLVAVNCAEPGGTCFCTSMGTGPRAQAGFDLGLTEVIEDDIHVLVVESGSAAGAALLERLAPREATEAERAAAERVWREAPTRMGRHMRGDAREVLAGALEHPRWEETAQRCLACANCTLACPTCFCSDTEEQPDLGGSASARVRRWDSCFNAEHSYMLGSPHRTTIAARYRQWLTHKLSTWHPQFGTSGCVGCGRCITWCPVGIDITEEVAAIAATGGTAP